MKCNWCKKESDDYYIIVQYEEGHMIDMSKMCYACATVSRKLRFA